MCVCPHFFDMLLSVRIIQSLLNLYYKKSDDSLSAMIYECVHVMYMRISVLCVNDFHMFVTLDVHKNPR